MTKSFIHNILLFIALALIVPVHILASEIDARVEIFNIESGLSQTNINSLLLDSYGFLWIGTQDGLNRYDGYGFKTYRNDPLDKTSLSNNTILSICEDDDGNLWIGTWRGLSVFNRVDETFTNYFHSPNDTSTISNDRVFEVFKDRSGVIWVKTTESVDRYVPENNSFVRHTHFADQTTFYSDGNDFSMFEDSQNRFWIATKDGLFLLNRKTGSFKQFTHNPKNNQSLSSNRITCITEDDENNLWVASSSGIDRFDSKTGVFKRYLNPARVIAEFRSINVIFTDSKGRLLVGTDFGLAQFLPQAKIIIPIKPNFDEAEEFSSSVNAIIEDNNQILWVGMQSGLLKWDLKNQKFKAYGKDSKGDNLFANNTVASILQDGKTTWVGTWGRGLFLFNRNKNRVVSHYSTSANAPYQIVDNYVHTIHRLNDGTVLIGTRNGVQKYNSETKTFTNFFESCNVNPGNLFAENRVYSIKEDNYGDIWFATRNGLHRFNYKSIESFFHNPNDSLSLSSNEVHCIELDGDYLWAGTFNGLNRINLANNRFEKFTRDGEYKVGGLIANDIVSLELDAEGDLWVGTSSGLHRYNKNLNTFELYTQSHGLPNNLIYAIKDDKDGNVWVSTNWGLARFDKETEQFTSYGVNDGLQSYEFNIGAAYMSELGEIFFGGINGFNAFYPDSITHNPFIPPIAITTIELIGLQGQQEISVVGKQEVVIDHDISLINIEFAALDFTRPQKNTFMYKMEGLEDEWIRLGNKHSATFSSLREGVYTFRVKGANSDNVWNHDGVALRVVVKTTFWNSRIAKIIYIVLIVLSLFLFLRVRTKMLRRTSRLLREREHTMEEIQNQKEALLIQNKSITDSINYAKRIQEALIPTEQHFKQILPESFILYMPKDIVSGDFYWINETENKIFVAAIDCTGHGVPGAFMSIIGVELLRNITNVMGVNDAAEILNRLDKGVHDTFSKGENENSSVKDGMDVSFCVVDKERSMLQFAGAFSNLYLIRDNKIIEIKGDRFSVGAGGDPNKPLFNSHHIPIQPEDMIYMFTDGYVDQFGGPEGKKYKFRRFRHLLLNIHKYPLDIQRKYLYGSINEWKGNLEQVDDILIIGIKPDLNVST